VNLDGRYDFDAIVVGPANRLAVAAGQAVAENPGVTYNPLYIWSAPGLGKTHLLTAIGLRARVLHPALHVVAMTLEEFAGQLHTAVSMADEAAFHRRFQDTGLLLLDDVQLMSGRRAVQAELLRLCEEFRANGRQIVCAGDRPPGDIADAESRLVHHLSGGLVVDIGPPAILASNGHSPRASGARPAPAAGEFLSFLTDVATVVARHVEPWRAAIGEAAERWAGEGYDTRVLRRALRGDSDPGSAALIATYERCVGRLRTLQCEAASIDADLASMDIFRDPARVAAAEDLVARARQHKNAAEEQARAESIDAPDTFEIIDVIEPVETDDVAPVEADDYQAEADYVEPEADEAPPVSVIARRTSRGMVITSIVADDPFFLDEEKVVWEWPDALGRVIEEFR
jgi:hypothetical protein